MDGAIAGNASAGDIEANTLVLFINGVLADLLSLRDKGCVRACMPLQGCLNMKSFSTYTPGGNGHSSAARAYAASSTVPVQNCL